MAAANYARTSTRYLYLRHPRAYTVHALPCHRITATPSIPLPATRTPLPAIALLARAAAARPTACRPHRPLPVLAAHAIKHSATSPTCSPLPADTGHTTTTIEGGVLCHQPAPPVALHHHYQLTQADLPPFPSSSPPISRLPAAAIDPSTRPPCTPGHPTFPKPRLSLSLPEPSSTRPPWPSSMATNGPLPSMQQSRWEAPKIEPPLLPPPSRALGFEFGGRNPCFVQAPASSCNRRDAQIHEPPPHASQPTTDGVTEEETAEEFGDKYREPEPEDLYRGCGLPLLWCLRLREGHTQLSIAQTLSFSTILLLLDLPPRQWRGRTSQSVVPNLARRCSSPSYCTGAYITFVHTEHNHRLYILLLQGSPAPDGASDHIHMARPHVLVVPYPGAGNINPSLQLAKLLHRHGVYVTFVNTEHNHRRVQDTEGAGAVRGRDGFRFEAIPDGLSEADRAKQDYGNGLAESITTCGAAHLRTHLERLNGGEPGVPPVTCVLATMLMSFALGVARELGIPTMVFWTTSAASLMADMRLRDLKDRDESYLTNSYLDTTIIDGVPGMPPMSLGDFSSFLRTTDPDDFCLRLAEEEPDACAKADALILNTFDSLEAEVLAALYTWPCSPRPDGPAHGTGGPVPARPEPSCGPWAATSARGPARARPGKMAGPPSGRRIKAAAAPPAHPCPDPRPAANPKSLIPNSPFAPRRLDSSSYPCRRRALLLDPRRESSPRGLLAPSPSVARLFAPCSFSAPTCELVFISVFRPPLSPLISDHYLSHRRRSGGTGLRSAGWCLTPRLPLLGARRGAVLEVVVAVGLPRPVLNLSLGDGDDLAPHSDDELEIEDDDDLRDDAAALFGIDLGDGRVGSQPEPIEIDGDDDGGEDARRANGRPGTVNRPMGRAARWWHGTAGTTARSGTAGCGTARHGTAGRHGPLDMYTALRANYSHIYTIGTLGSLLSRVTAADDSTNDSDTTGLSLWKQDAECLSWLDTQEQCSVVYVNFGSLTVVTPEQLTEFAWGLVASGHPFLWCIRDGSVRGRAALPPAFTAETAGRCHLTSWCPQEQVLRHPAVGCFVTHSGWNSTCESLAAAVPMVCWPGFADQYTNCKYACDVWGVGVRLGAVVRGEQVASHVREVMGSEEMRRRWRPPAQEGVDLVAEAVKQPTSKGTALIIPGAGLHYSAGLVGYCRTLELLGPHQIKLGTSYGGTTKARWGVARDEKRHGWRGVCASGRGQCGVACASKRRKTEMRQDKWWKDGVDSAGTSGGLMEREGGSTRIKGELRARACGGCAAIHFPLRRNVLAMATTRPHALTATAHRPAISLALTGTKMRCEGSEWIGYGAPVALRLMSEQFTQSTCLSIAQTLSSPRPQSSSSAQATRMAWRPQVVVVPYPGAGNINPALQLAKLLPHHGVYVTFVNTEHNHRRPCAARELGIPTMAFWTGSAASLMADMRLRDLMDRDESYLTNGYLDTTVIDWVPGMPPVSLGSFSSFLRTTDPDDFCLRLIEAEANVCAKANALILNTFDTLEADVLAALRAEYPRIYTIGALTSLLRHDSSESDTTGLSLWKQDAECLTWLDTQEPCSVVYANFGSNTVLSPEKLAEFAWGLAASGHPFLWSIRDDLVRGGGGLAALPPAFVAETAGRCYLTSWCPQEQVLCDAQRVELDVREPRRRRADGVLAGVRRTRQRGDGERGDAEEREQVEGGSGDGRQPRWILV
ncbi:hypothetical protein HU200_013864 [Digitaria exilis]|uniref:Uncharacterized protein n=1 Tax=Digitaria exilis TaxID=1010633 RepID=A0A835FDG8_9POAL|nr:hypothetical protein HU200_013864 [Digitaria exilis]